tara:strand:- start:1061 stop:1345 length:285 start_codon:yes stop_codon:yes gene_type:complete
MEIKETNKIPDYLQDFISNNKKQLLELFNNEENKTKNHIIMNCNESENKINVSFLDIEQLSKFFEKNEEIFNQIIQGNYNCIICDLKGIFLLKF